MWKERLRNLERGSAVLVVGWAVFIERISRSALHKSMCSKNNLKRDSRQ